MKHKKWFVFYILILLEIFFRILFPASDITRVMQWQLDPNTMYVLKPGATMIFDGQFVRLPPSRISINSFGMRDHPYTLQKNAHKRIAFLGDSVVFGWGLSSSHTFIKILERKLQNEIPGIQVMNFGVFGYNIHQYLWTLQNRVGQFHPDLLVVFLNRDDLINVARGFNPLRQKWIRVVQPVLRASRVLRMCMSWGILIRNRIRFRTTNPAWEKIAMNDLKKMMNFANARRTPLLFYVYESSLLTQNLFTTLEKDISSKKTPHWIFFSRRNKKCIGNDFTFRGDPHPNPRGAACIADDLLELILREGETLQPGKRPSGRK